jgi:hypothetical protein
MSKRKKRKALKISPATTLRPRLDHLWAGDALLHQDDAAIEAGLDTVARDVAPDFLVETMLRAYLSAPAAVRARLDRVLPRWLSQHGHVSTLKDMVSGQRLAADLRAPALSWMEAAGVDTRPFESPPDLFFRAYYYDDAATLGEKSQAYVAVFWYTSPRKKRAQGMGFLLDYNPPWDGSVKDILVTPERPPDRALRDFVNVWASGGMEPGIVSAQKAKIVILTALHCNRAAHLRLPRDLIAAREIFVRHVLSLPDAPDTPSFTMHDFDFLARNGKRPEQVVHFEQTVGRRVRLQGGKELLVMGSPDWEDERL